MNSSKIDSTAFSPTVRTRGLCGGSGAGERINQLAKDGRINEDERKAMRANGGQLNPDWVEWLMGWPIGWTDLDKENEQLDWLRLEFDPADLPEEDERFIPRITSRKQYRIQRITALGNGQVPLCAAIAFDIGLGLFNINDNSTEKETK